MPAELSDSVLGPPGAERAAPAGESGEQRRLPVRADFSATQRLLLLGLNLAPLAHAGASIAAALMAPGGWMTRLGAAAAMLYLAPLFVAALVRLAVPIPQGAVPAGSAAFFGWWALLKAQSLFSRFPALEEALRLVPGLYSLWLRMWGARIGRLTYWAPGTVILDRSFLDIGDYVVVGAGVRFCPHLFTSNAAGEMELQLGTIHVGDRASIGGFSVLAPGSRIAGGESTPACLILTPFSTWQGGKRLRRGAAC